MKKRNKKCRSLLMDLCFLEVSAGKVGSGLIKK